MIVLESGNGARSLHGEPLRIPSPKGKARMLCTREVAGSHHSFGPVRDQLSSIVVTFAPCFSADRIAWQGASAVWASLRRVRGDTIIVAQRQAAGDDLDAPFVATGTSRSCQPMSTLRATLAPASNHTERVSTAPKRWRRRRGDSCPRQARLPGTGRGITPMPSGVDDATRRLVRLVLGDLSHR